MDFILLQSTPTTGPVPFSAYALCYFPLAAVVFGLLAAFFLTDWHARRPYLRFNEFLAARLSREQLARRAPQTGETPAGSLGPTGAGNTTVFQGRGMGDVAPATSGNAGPDVTARPASSATPRAGGTPGVGKPPISPVPTPRKDNDRRK